MTTIKFKNGNMFDQCIGKYDLFLFYGNNGMAFGLGYLFLRDRYNEFKNIGNPFATHANQPIPYSNNKKLVCIPADYMTNDELSDNLTLWLEYAREQKFRKISLTGVRDSLKIGMTDITEAKINDNNRVKFIVEFIKKWLQSNKSNIMEVLLISASDNYTRNYNESIII
jgi:hypothetical protein